MTKTKTHTRSTLTKPCFADSSIQGGGVIILQTPHGNNHHTRALSSIYTGHGKEYEPSYWSDRAGGVDGLI